MSLDGISKKDPAVSIAASKETLMPIAPGQDASSVTLLALLPIPEFSKGDDRVVPSLTLCCFPCRPISQHPHKLHQGT